jgi:hypothetical protein
MVLILSIGRPDRLEKSLLDRPFFGLIDLTKDRVLRGCDKTTAPQNAIVHGEGLALTDGADIYPHAIPR